MTKNVPVPGSGGYHRGKENPRSETSLHPERKRSPNTRALAHDCGPPVLTLLPPPSSAPVARGTPSLTYESVQGCGVIQELLSQVSRANSSHASDTYRPQEVLFHEHGGQGHGFQTVGRKAVGDEPVHQGGACIGARAAPVRRQATVWLPWGCLAGTSWTLTSWAALGSTQEQTQGHNHMWPSQTSLLAAGSCGLNTGELARLNPRSRGSWFPPPAPAPKRGGSPMKVFL